jgi:hypothetical protein
MNKEAYDAKIVQLISEEYAALSHATLQKFGDQTIDELVRSAFMERLRAEVSRNPEFENDMIEQVVQSEIDQYLEELRPNGSYRSDGMFPISDQAWINMPKAKREHLRAWSAIERDPANSKYIASRLAAWESTKYQILEELERSLQAGVN